MTPISLLHAAEARLGLADPERAERSRDRIAVFERLVDEALGSRADGVLVAGSLLETGAPSPSALAEVCAVLDRARRARIPVVSTAESGEAPWLGYLAAEHRLELLAVDRATPTLPVIEPRSGLRIVGLGRPADAGELAARLELLGRMPSLRQTVALLHGPIPGPGPGHPALELSSPGLVYVAAGGSSLAVERGIARDPGPLTRLTLEEDGAEPRYLRLGLRATGVQVEPVPAGDRPLVSARIDLATTPTPAAVEQALQALLASAAPAPRPLLRVELHGRAPFDLDDLDEGRLLAVARETLDPLETRLLVTAHLETAAGDRLGAATDWRDLEQQVASRLAAGRERGLDRLAAELLAPLLRGDADSLAWARGRLERSLGRPRRSRARKAAE